VLVAHGVGCAEVIRATAAIGFDNDRPPTLHRAVEQAVAHWRANSNRVTAPLDALRYDPSVQVHVRALLQIVQEVSQQ
jgi:hypothetical protein